MDKKLNVLIIMDGYGIGEPGPTNAVEQADTPKLDVLFSRYPHTTVKCSGLDVGLPPGQMGNSEVGHLNLGAGRVVYQPLTRVTKAIEDGEFFTNPALTGVVDHVRAHGTALHVMGLISHGGVHSHGDHLLAIIRMARYNGIEKIYIHCFMDGRDVPPTSGKDLIVNLEGDLKDLGAGTIATVSGRFYAMDRDNIWNRVDLAYRALVMGQGQVAGSAVEAMEQSYMKGETDEFVLPTVIQRDGRPVAAIGPQDGVVFFNFRPDRARQLTRAFVDPAFPFFERPRGWFPLYFVTMALYDATLPGVHIAFEPQSLKNTLGEYLSGLGYTQLRIAETQKYAHVTYFFNGGVEHPNPGEDRVLIDSPKIGSFADKPEMSAYEVTDEVERRIASGAYDFIIINYANCDMVGHTGVMAATVEAVEAVDACVDRVVTAARKMGGRVIITADHGNAEIMWDKVNDVPYTAHSSDNPVPFIVVDDRFIGARLRDDGRLCDVVPTMLEMAGVPQPPEMTGHSLLP